jgi:hypothetical protein
MSPVKVTVSGPLFEPGAEQVLTDMRDDLAERMVTEAHRRVLNVLDASLKHPTGYYRRHITRYGPVGGQGRVHDQQVIYGPWLNGTGSRNRTTRFKGYGHFKRTEQELRRAAKPLGNQVVADHLHKLGG